MSISNKAVKRKYEEEKREFKLEWEELYFFIQKNDKPFCLICQVTLSQFKVSNLKRHYETNHSTFSREFPIGSDSRKNKLCSMKLKFAKQTNVMTMFTNEADDCVEASFVIAFNIAQAKRPYTDGEYIKKNILDVISVLNPENQKLLKMVENVPVSRHTIERRISTISFDIFTNLKNNIANCLSLSLALDESTDIQDKPQLAIFVRYVTSDVDVKEELLDLISLKETTRGIDIKIALDETLQKAEIPLNKIISISTDGAPSMVGCKNGLIGLLKNDTNFPDFIPIHCILHREHLTAKYFKYDHVMDVVLKIVNYIRSSAKTHRQFKNFLEDIEDDIPNDVPWYCLVRWLSVNNILTKFFQLIEPIKVFLIEKNKSFPQLSNSNWLRDLAFFTDIMQHLSTLNVSLQGQNKLVNDLGQKVFSFQNKLKLFIRDLQSNNFTHFSCLEKIEAFLIESEIKINCDDYVLKLEFLFTDFEERFRDLKALKPSFGFLENPFLVNVIEKGCPLSHPIITNKADLEIELLELLEDEGLKQFINNCPSILEFWKHISILKYPNIKNCAVKLISIFGTTYSCESLYSTMKIIKSKYRSNLTDDHLTELLRTALTSIQPDLKKLTKKVDTKKIPRKQN
ncbi:general transcription factor II-I repeat domain-containing protein 2B-like [Rhopalosiphum padi]|uniref:general transcription factor II-I repeat domain-containing protein 2B-like n=1 Tax=Rhopalosiphum padi TaxID=40932 RepID=UPI00298E9F2E|nr:general transcription factor II-I repeat domain-containing protein 2B-like [Rhopalosiphum padi]